MLKKIVLAVLCVMVMAGISYAQETKFLQLAVFNPVQLVPEDQSIKGVRLDLFYTVNKDVTGFSLSFLGVNRATGNVSAVELGLGNWVEGYFHGVQYGLVNYTVSRFVGWQAGAVNIT